MFHVAGDLYIYSRGNYVNEQSEWNNLVTYIVYCVAVLWTGSSRVFGICCRCERGKDVSFFTHIPIHFCLFVGLLFTHCLIPVLMKCTSICSTNEWIGSMNTDPCVDKKPCMNKNEIKSSNFTPFGETTVSVSSNSTRNKIKSWRSDSRSQRILQLVIYLRCHQASPSV